MHDAGRCLHVCPRTGNTEARNYLHAAREALDVLHALAVEHADANEIHAAAYDVTQLLAAVARELDAAPSEEADPEAPSPQAAESRTEALRDRLLAEGM